MSWPYSRALVEASLAAGCSAGEPSAPSRSTPMPQAFSSPDRTTVFSRLSRFGMTCEPLTDTHGAVLLTWSRAASRARTSASPARARASTARAAGSGRRWRGSLARFDRRSRSWRTAQRCLFADSSESWVTWPRSGMTAAGRCWELAMSAPRTSATASGFWLGTPVATGRKRSEAFRRGKTPNVPEFVEQFPTPTASMSASITPSRGEEGRNLPQALSIRWPTPHGFSPDGRSNGPSGNELGRAVNLSLRLPTPTAHNAKETASPGDYARNTPTLATHAGGSLNPTWVEWLMGWPLGWTDLRPSATVRFRSARRRRGRGSSRRSRSAPAPSIEATRPCARST